MDFASIFVIVGIFVILHDVGLAQAACPPDFEEVGGHCYKVVNARLDWENAKQYCEYLRADLAHILDSREQYNIVKLTLRHGRMKYYLAGTNIEKINTWIWKLGWIQLPFSFKNWKSGSPKNIYSQRCLLFESISGNWDDWRCTAEQPFICRLRSSLYSNGVEIMNATDDDVLKVNEEMDL